MTEFDPDDYFEQTGIDTRLKQQVVERSLPALSPFAERLRDDLLHHVSTARAGLEMLETTLRDRPADDATFDAIDASFSDSLGAARASFERYRGHRECSGEC